MKNQEKVSEVKNILDDLQLSLQYRGIEYIHVCQLWHSENVVYFLYCLTLDVLRC